MPASVDALQSLINGPLNAYNAKGEPNGMLAARKRTEDALLAMRRSMELQAGDPQHTFSGATHADINDTQDSLDEDPNFGTEATQRVKDVENTNAEMATYNRPDVTAQRKEDLANKLALESMKSVAPVEAQTRGALALENQKAGHESAQRNETLKAYLGMGGEGGPGAPAGSQRTVHIGVNGEPTISIAPPPKPGQLEQRTLTTMAEAQPILDKLDQELGNPNSDALSQLLSKGKNMGTQALYGQGLSTGNQTKQQLEGLLQVLGSSSYVVGSRSFQLIKQAMAHLTNTNGSDAFNKQQIQEIRSLWPQMQQEVMNAHLAAAQGTVTPLNQGAPAADPAGIR